jgi:hypothetical protein
MILKAPVIAVTTCLLATLPSSILAQTAAAKGYPSVSKETHENSAYTKHRASSEVAEGQRALAVSKLISLADEANSFKDQALRVRIQARVADTLWETDRVESRRLFLQAWQTAESVDKAGALTADDSSKKALTSRQGLTFVPPPPNLRSEVLSLVARRDQQLAETLLSRLEEPKESEAENRSGDNQSSFFDPTEPPQYVAKRLEVATELLKAGETERAEGIADPGLKYATTQGIIFLSTLRQKDAKAADERFSRLLALSANDQRADATTVSLLSSYIFTPNLIITATKRGRVSNQWGEQAVTANPPEVLRSNFLRVAADILLRPLTPPDQDSTSAGRGGAYFTITRLLPVFGQYAPDYVPELNARLTLLAQDTLPTYKNNDNGMLTAGFVPHDPSSDELSAILDPLSSAVGTGDRDLIYLKAVRAAAANGDARIREFADQIDNAEVKKRARAFADFVVVRKALADKNVDSAVRITSEGELQPLQGVWAYSEAAGLLNESDISRAAQLLEEATSEAQNINSGELDRVYALACVASRFLRVDRARAWEIAADVVKASNAASDLNADDGKLTARLQARGVVAMESFSVPSFNLTNLFAALAKDNYLRAEALAETFKGEAPRATAKLALARVLLTKKGN